jgi:hypothetical protein
MCVFKGVVRCATCEGGVDPNDMLRKVIDEVPRIEWPEH